MFYDKLQQGENMPIQSISRSKILPVLWGLITINLLFLLYELFFSSTMICDDIEHLRVAYYISLGDVPYRDFFEHHHPLLWYVLLPLIKFLPLSTTLGVYTGRLLSLLVSLGAGYYFYRIMRKFIGGKTVALLAIVIYFTGLPSWYALFNIKPDAYMRLFYFMGLYYLFSYFRYQKRTYLCICGVAWMVGFLFLQTIVLDVLPLILPIGWFLYRHPAKIKDFICAAVVPLVILTVFAGILIYSNTWNAYYETNWLFNSKLSDFLSKISQPKFLFLFIDIIVAGILGTIYFLQKDKRNIYCLSLCLLFVTELLQRIFWVGIFSQYYVMLFAFAGMVAAPAVYKLWQKHHIVFWLAVFFAGVHILANAVSLRKADFFTQAGVYLEQKNVPLSQTWGTNCGIYQPRRGLYYWAMVDVEALHNILFRQDKSYNLMQILLSDDIKYYCPASLSYQKKFLIRLSKYLNMDAQQKEILQQHVLDQAFDENYDNLLPTLYQKVTHEH